MTEQKVKKRGWVKNVAIIFLTVMLALTFFSNSIMNRSLPEVAAQYVQSGSINAKIRGSGTITANENFEVKSTQTRKVLSVPVKVGDKVAVDDVLINFADADSVELKTVQDELDALVLAYKKALVNASGADYAKETREIQLAQKALDKAKADRVKYAIDGNAITNAENAASSAKTDFDVRQAAVNVAQTNLDALGGKNPGTSGDYSAVTAAQNSLEKAKKDRSAKMLIHSAAYNALKTTADANKGTNPLDIYMTYLADVYSAYDKATDATQKEQYKQYLAYVAVSEADAKVATAQQAYDAAYNAYYNSSSGGNEYEWNKLNKLLTEAKALLVTAENVKNTADNNLKTLQDKKVKFDEADAAVDTNQTALENAMFALAEKRKADGKAQATESLDLANMKTGIDQKNEQLAGLKGGGLGASVKSLVNGVVTTINVTAGNNSEKDQVLMVVEVPDMGFSVNIPVTAEQAKKVNIGDPAEIQYNYYGNDITATLAGIKNDPQNPTTKKLLVFKITGDVQSGAQLNLAIGERGANYETIVPNSALRSDNNGSFVLAVIAKNTPLGNRYIATRIDVKVLASDDVNSAVSGGISYNEFVITTSTKPIEPGMQVRMTD